MSPSSTTKRLYRFPMIGTVIKRHPLQGADNDPLRPIPIDEIAGYADLTQDDKGYVCSSYDYNLDGEFVEMTVEATPALHKWLALALANLERTDSWKLNNVLANRITYR